MDQNGVSSIMAMLVYRSVSRNSECFEDVFNASFFGGAGGQISFTSSNISRTFTSGTWPPTIHIIRHPNELWIRSSGLKVLLTSVKLIPNLVSSLISSAVPKQTAKKRIRQNSSITEFSKGVAGKVKKNCSTFKRRLEKHMCLNRRYIYTYDALLDYGG